MRRDLSKPELVALVQRIMDCEGTEDEVRGMVRLLEANVPDPDVSDLIYRPRDGEPTAEEVVERALAYHPILLPPGGQI
jgi:hypothetical protein